MNINDKTLKKILNKINKLKNKKYGEIFIEGNFQENKFRLLLITNDCLKDILIIKLLSKWRKENEFWFPVIFKVTKSGTKIWLAEKVINTPDRLLFMINVKNQYIGHVGLFRFNFKNKICEIDNILRGRSLYPGIMGEAINTMMNWGKVNLGLLSYKLQTSSDNKRALKLYHSLGFIEEKREPLVQIKKGDRLEWIKAPKNYKGRIKRHNVFMKLP